MASLGNLEIILLDFFDRLNETLPGQRQRRIFQIYFFKEE